MYSVVPIKKKIKLKITIINTTYDVSLIITLSIRARMVIVVTIQTNVDV